MHNYRVVNRCTDESWLTLQCGAGRCHPTRAFRAVPPVGSGLGSKLQQGPELGLVV